MSSNIDKYWLAVTALLVISLISGGTMLIIKLVEHRPLEITITKGSITDTNAEVYIDGAVVNPGYYPLKEDDSIDSLIKCAGLKPDADLQQVKLFISPVEDPTTPQRISLNRADAWLLEALPGIGSEKAKAIIEYRTENGGFKRVDDLLQINGIGTSTLDNIKEFITVEE
jgi:competence protein ComEA